MTKAGPKNKTRSETGEPVRDCMPNSRRQHERGKRCFEWANHKTQGSVCSSLAYTKSKDST